MKTIEEQKIFEHIGSDRLLRFYLVNELYSSARDVLERGEYSDELIKGIRTYISQLEGKEKRSVLF